MPSLSKVGSEMLDGALPAISGASLTNLDARDLENALPAISGASLTSLPSPAVHYFNVEGNAEHTVADSTSTKITNWDETLDTDSWFATGTYTPQVAGKYYFYGQMLVSTEVYTSLNWHSGAVHLKKNGTVVAEEVKVDYNQWYGQQMSMSCAVVCAMNGSSDYLELWGYANTQDGSDGKLLVDYNRGVFCGFYLGA